jgi:epoxyqueuosine reductase
MVQSTQCPGESCVPGHRLAHGAPVSEGTYTDQAMTFRERIKARALELGFDVVGICPAGPAEHLPFYLEWLAAGYHGTQDYLARPDRVARRQDLNIILPGARSLVVVGSHYWPGPPPPEVRDPARGHISCYAQGPDYHQIMLPMLEALLEFVRTQARRPVRGRVYVDTGPLLERDHALAAGLGFIGKNCNLVRPRNGSWSFLGVLLLDIPLESDRSEELGAAASSRSQPGCGRCTRCLEACPTGALVRPFTLDSRRCISYLTTALKGAIPRELRRHLGNHIFGCDICQTVCPWNRFARPAEPPPLAQPRVHPAPLLLELIGLSASEFQARYGHTPIGHRGHELFLRNVAVALGNWGAAEAVPSLVWALENSEPLVRGHAAWALGEIGGAAAHMALEEAMAREENPGVADEISRSLAP